jgi:hypothetical protein
VYRLEKRQWGLDWALKVEVRMTPLSDFRVAASPKLNADMFL